MKLLRTHPFKLSRRAFLPGAQSVFRNAQKAASHLGHSYVGSEHLLLALSQDEDSPAAQTLHAVGLYPPVIRKKIMDLQGSGSPIVLRAACLTPRCHRIIERATLYRLSDRCPSIDSTHIFLSLLQEKEGVAISLICETGVTPTHLHELLTASMQGDGASPFQPRGRNEREFTPTDSRLLEQFSRDMVRQAACGEFDPLIGREVELQRCMQILIRRSKNNPVLLGDPGVGKTAVVEGLALRMAAGQVPEALRSKRLLSLDLSSMVAGTKYRGEFEERVKNIVREVRKAGNIILFLDELHTIVGAGSAEGAIDAANILKPALSRGDIQMIGATTLEEYRRYIEKDPALERRFQPVTVDEPTPDAALTILRRLAPHYEQHHHVRISPEALEAAVRLSQRYIPDRRLPDKAIDLIDEAASFVRMGSISLPDHLKSLEDKVLETFQEKEAAIRSQNFEKAAMLRNAESDFRVELETLKRKWRSEQSADLVSVDTVASVLAQWTGIPASSLSKEERKYLLELEDVLHKRVAGQEKAVHAVAEAIRRGRSGLKDPKRPIGAFLFLGPSGVGKTELCKALAEAMFGTEEALLRFDMTEYAEAHSVSRLLGSPPGYVGFDDGGQLTEQVRRRPYSVVLFDELEKAHADIWSILLQIMDDGRLTDSKGRTVDFRSTVVVMTSNVGADKLSSHGVNLGFIAHGITEKQTLQQNHGSVMTTLRKTFRPEFLNRLDETIIFDPLSKEEMEIIAAKMMQEIASRLEASGVFLHYAPDILTYLAEKGFDPAYGARPLRRLLQNQVENPAAQMLLSNQLIPGESLIICMQDGNLHLHSTAEAQPVVS